MGKWLLRRKEELTNGNKAHDLDREEYKFRLEQAGDRGEKTWLPNAVGCR